MGKNYFLLSCDRPQKKIPAPAAPKNRKRPIPTGDPQDSTLYSSIIISSLLHYYFSKKGDAYQASAVLFLAANLGIVQFLKGKAEVFIAAVPADFAILNTQLQIQVALHCPRQFLGGIRVNMVDG